MHVRGVWWRTGLDAAFLRLGREMRVHFEWVLVAGIIGILMYMGQSQFHQKHLNVFLIIGLCLVFLIMVGFYRIRGKR